ncbi:MAG: hypothetical protein OXT69_07270 [Candidatus Poribacteria bacterium]|nr:hypothetical protein [Candidatus Poribacteria bacterium]
MALLRRLTDVRKQLADRALGGGPLPFSAEEVTRVSAWCCFLAGWACMGGRLGWALGLLIACLLLDVADGVAARRNDEDNPHVDWAADRFGELALIGGLFWRDSIWVGGAYSACYALNIFLPRWRIPVLPLRHVLAAYWAYRILAG